MLPYIYTFGVSLYSHICQATAFHADTLENDKLIPTQQNENVVIQILSWIGFIWWTFIMLITAYGYTEIVMKLRNPKAKPLHTQFEDGKLIDSNEIEGVTILRPIKGIDPELRLCLESSFLQKYPPGKLQILFCVESPNDPAIPIIKSLLTQYPEIDADLLIDDDQHEKNHFGPNPKINNLAKGYKQAKFDIVWVLDSNVWVNPGTLLRSTISLNHSLDNGRQTSRKVKLVHHIPLAVSIDHSNTPNNLGARLDEMFLFTSHAKFYVFFNKASVAPCVNGKSNLYRRSEIDDSVRQISQGKFWNTQYTITRGASEFTAKGEGLRFFARYIGEDNMIGTAIWEKENGGRTGMTTDIAIQPIGGVTAPTNKINDYVNRRVRWLRVRRYMVLFATLLEPTTESLVIGTFGAFGISNIFFGGYYKIPLFILHEIIWCITDYSQYSILLKYSDKDLVNPKNENLPFFLNVDQIYDEKMKLYNWLPIWILREILALPIWIIAMCGTQIDWRNRPFKIRSDLTAEEL